MQHQRRQMVLVLTLINAAFLCAIAWMVGSWLVRGRIPSQAEAQLAQARTRWAAAGLTHYRLTFDECSVEVRNEQVVARENSCLRPQQTVPELFDLVEYYITRDDGMPGPNNNGLSCPEFLRVEVEYDAHFGHPLTLHLYQENRQTWWMQIRCLFVPCLCTAIGAGYHYDKVGSPDVTPLAP